MSETRRKLLAKAQEYDSEAEFKANDLPSYLLAKKKRVLHLAFPPEEEVEEIPGIYYLYKDQRVMYIGMSEVDARTNMQSLLEVIPVKINNYKLFHPVSSADTRVLYHYLVAKYKPKYNTDVVSDLLTINIPEATSLLGEPERGTL